MPIVLDSLAALPRLLLDVALAPVQGHRFQPTGFPDLGAATFQSGATDCLLVESAQSMANRLEATVWNEGAQDLIPVAQGLSYVRVNGKDGKFLTASILEAHRLNSVYIEMADKKSFSDTLKKACDFNDKEPVNRPAFLAALLRYDVNSLLHGTFLESIGGRLRLPRALSAFIEAEGVRVAASGGVKNDHVSPSKEDGREAKDGYGNVPFQREEYTAQRITASFNLDLQQIRSYGLGEAATRLLILTALFKIRALLDGNLRLRTACDFQVCDAVITSRSGFVLPSLKDLEAEVPGAIAAARSQLGGDQAVTTITFAK